MIIAEELTKRQSLEECAKLWRWCQANPGARKHDYPGWGDWDRHPISVCPLCQFAMCHQDSKEGCYCRFCPLYSKWGKYARCHTPAGNGLYNKWNEADSAHMEAKYAGMIADLCEKELEVTE